MPTGQTFTRWDGTVVPQSQANFGDYLFHGSGEINPALRTLISMTPYAGGIYTAGRGFNALMTYLGKHGLFGQPGGDSGTPTPTVAPTNSTPFADPTDPNNPANYSLPDGSATSGTPARGASDLRNVLNTGRFTNAPAFSQTVAQAMFPGSAIGPWGGGATNPYQGQFVHPSGGTGMSPMAAVYSNYINSRTIR